MFTLRMSSSSERNVLSSFKNCLMCVMQECFGTEVNRHSSPPGFSAAMQCSFASRTTDKAKERLLVVEGHRKGVAVFSQEDAFPVKKLDSEDRPRRPCRPQITVNI